MDCCGRRCHLVGCYFKMSFLKLENGEVVVTDEGMQLPEVQVIYKRDRNSNKSYFKKVIKYVYFVYKPDSTFSEILYTERKREVFDKFVKTGDVEAFINDTEIEELGKSFEDKSVTHEEKLLIRWKEDVQQYLDMLTSIPYYRVVNGVQIPNITEKENALKAATNIIKVKKSLDEMVNASRKKGRASTARVFDRKDI